ncbi:LPS translocon maturation chaperone LptM [Aliivibrio logei]|nr:lipoprotein [Aliivibrio logei]
MQKRVMALMLLSVLALAGCGQTGGLYMPTDDVPKTEAAE